MRVHHDKAFKWPDVHIVHKQGMEAPKDFNKGVLGYLRYFCSQAKYVIERLAIELLLEHALANEGDLLDIDCGNAVERPPPHQQQLVYDTRDGLKNCSASSMDIRCYTKVRCYSSGLSEARAFLEPSWKLPDPCCGMCAGAA